MSLVGDDDDHANSCRKINPGTVQGTQTTPPLFGWSCHPEELAQSPKCSLGFLNLEASCRQEPIFNFMPKMSASTWLSEVGFFSHHIL